MRSPTRRAVGRWGVAGVAGVALALLATVLITDALVAQEKQEASAVRGVVTASEAQKPLFGVTVQIVELGIGIVTNERGRYMFEGIKPGTYTLRFSSPGRATVEETVQVDRAIEQVLDVALEIQPIPISPISVLHARTRMVGDPTRAQEIPGSAHFITSEELKERKILYDDIHQVLRTVPGVNIQEEDGYGLRPNIGMRGTGTERSSKITLMEDGVLIAPAPYAAPAAYYFPVVGRMEAVEVRKGSSQIKYGPRTIGGALNLISNSIPSSFTLDVEAVAGEDATRKVQGRVGDSYKHVGWLAETYQIETDGFKRLDGGGDTGFDINDYVAKFRVNSDPTSSGFYHQLELKLGLHDEHSSETYLGLTNADFDANPRRRYPASRKDVMTTDHEQYQARYFIQPRSNVDIAITVYRNDFARNWFKLQSVGGENIADVLDQPENFPDQLAILRGANSEDDALKVRANNREYYSQGLQSTFGFRFEGLRAAHDVEFGIRYHKDQEDRFQHEDGFRMLDGQMVPTSEGAPGSQSNRVSDATAWSFYVQDEIEFGRFMVIPGLRFETIDFVRTDFAKDDPARTAPNRVRKNSVDAWIPGIGARFLVRPDLRLFGGVHRGFGPPGPGADDETEAEKSINYELGARFRRAGLQAQLVGFFSDYDNILGAETLASGTEGSGDLFNGGEVNVWGVEASASYDFLQGLDSDLGLPIRVAYTYTSAEFQSAFESDFNPWGTVEPGDELPYLPEHQLHASLGLRTRSGSVRLEANHNSATRTRAGQGPIPEGQGTDAFLVFNLSAEYAIKPWSALFVGIENLTDEKHIVARRPAGARPGLPRTIQAGIRITR